MVAQQKAEAVAMAKWEEDNRKRQEAPLPPTADEKRKERERRLGLRA